MSSTSSKLLRIKGLSRRKAEIRKEAEKRRTDELQRIKNPNWNHKEGLNATEVFPEEVWKMVLDTIKDPQDLESTRRACKLFRDLLERRRVRDILLPLVLNVKEFSRMLKPTKPDISPPASEDLSVNDEKPRIKQSAFTTLRSVCKRWRDAVDYCFELDIDEEKFLDRYHQLPKTLLFWNTFARDPDLCFAPLIKCHWSNPPDEAYTVETLISNYSAKLSNNVSPRFPPRALRVLVDFSAEDCRGNLEKCEEFLNSITKALELMGGDLVRFMFMELTNHICLPPFIYRDAFYNKLQKWCVLMPSLKWLSVDLTHCDAYLQDEDVKRELRSEVRKAIEKNPFPRMEKLTTLSLESQLTSNASEEELFMAILDSNRQINELFVNGRKFQSKIGSALYDMIKSLELISFGVTNVDVANVMKDGICMVKDVEAITNFSWQLRSIHLIFESCDKYYELPIRRLFKFMERFQTLEYVTLEMDVVSIQGTNRIILHLPNLKQFSFKFFHNLDLDDGSERCQLAEMLLDGKEFFESIDYLRHCSKLENIHWENPIFHMLHPALTYKRKDQLIDFHGGILGLQHSNIWDVFPSLKIVKIWKLDDKSVLWMETYKRGCQKIEKTRCSCGYTHEN